MYSINDEGAAAVTTFIYQNAKSPAAHNLNFWMVLFEHEAGERLPNGEIVVLELKAHETISGRVETLTLSADCFDAF